VNYQDQDNLVHWRYSRRLGEQVPDASYACSLEGPRPSRRKLTKAVLIVALFAAVALTIKVLA
jgi:hypothetical protein